MRGVIGSSRHSAGAATEYRQHRFSAPPGATDILLIRHGESAPARLDAPAPLVDGQSDPDLDMRGREEAERVADRLDGEEVSAIYVTNLRRTAQTATPLAFRLGIQPRVEPDLREVYLGEWEGATFRKRMAERHPLALRMLEEQRWDAIPGAESFDVLRKRVRDGIERIAAAHTDRRVAVFTHGGVIAMVLHLATDCAPFAFLGADNGSVTHLVVMPQRWLIRRFNDTGHLGTDLDRPPQPLE
jgi:probable phosphoglycerate mutase